MTGSASSRLARGRALLVFGLLAGCSSYAGPPPQEALQPLPSLGARVPGQADRLAHDAAAAALADDREGVGVAVTALVSLEADRAREALAPTGLVPYAIDLQHATTTNRLGYEAASRVLLERDDLDPALRRRLEAVVADDERLLAGERLSDARTARIGRIFNALVEPVGRSLMNGVMLPWRLARSISSLVAREYTEDELSLPERQALAYWKEFVENHPEQPEAEHLIERIDRDQERWNQTRRDQVMRRARRAVERGQDGAAMLLAERALRYVPEDREASALREQARVRLDAQRDQAARSLEAAPGADTGSGRALTLALLAGGAEEVEARAATIRASGEVELADEADFALAVAARERGDERTAWERFEDVAEGPESSNMARHAWTILDSAEQNPHRYYERARSEELSRQLRWLALGPLGQGPIERDLPDPVEWMLDLPAFPAMVMGLPNRLIRYPWAKPRSQSPPVYARLYLDRYPEGVHAAELRHWLVDHEVDAGDFAAAATLAAQDPQTDPEELAELREQAAEQTLAGAARVPRRDVRVALLRRVATEYHDTEAGREAGERARTELEEATPQRIRVSREYLHEHPRVAGPEGLALRAELLDGELDNGELHPAGVTLLGGRVIELAFVDEDGRERGEPLVRRQAISEERLARVVALLAEASRRDVMVDPDLPLEPDADRDQYFERVRLGLTDEPDLRASAQSTYTFQGTRERYGLVRQRESVLPVDLVFQVSGGDLGLGAFPRMRAPRETPDAILYR